MTTQPVRRNGQSVCSDHVMNQAWTAMGDADTRNRIAANLLIGAGAQLEKQHSMLRAQRERGAGA